MLADRIRMARWGSKKLIDRTTPTVVVNQPYSTEGNGGRKLVRLSNGWLVAGVRHDIAGYGIRLFISKDNGLTWNLYGTSSIGATHGWALSSKDNIIYLLLSNGNTTYSFYAIDTNVFIPNSNIGSTGTITAVNIEVGQIILGNCSLAINPQGTELHACWSSKNSTYPNSFNIRYCKGIINGDGSVTWGSVDQGTGQSLNDNLNPTIVIKNNIPIIIYSYHVNNWAYIMCIEKSTNTFVRYNIYNPGTGYMQSNPSACVDKDGVIHVTWSGAGSTSSQSVYYSKSTNGGFSWSDPTIVFVNTNNANAKPSISINNKNEVFISFQYSLHNRVYKSTDGVNWSQVSNQIHYSSDPSLLLDNELGFELPLTILSSTELANSPYKNSVLFYGKWYE